MPPSVVRAQTAPQNVLNLPIPGTMIPLSDVFTPPLMNGLTFHANDPLRINFMINTGDTDIEGDELKAESTRLIKYFLASLTIPHEDMWVNLSPYESDRIIPENFGDTQMGRDLLAQDYMLKQVTASLMYPEEELGADFWNKVHEQAYARFGTTDIPMNTFNKIWIVPEKASVYERESSVFVTDSYLKVMLEEDYVALQENMDKESFGLDSLVTDEAKIVSGVSSDVVREVLIPAIEKEVNQGTTFSQLRQVYNSVILATWYKKNLKESLLGHMIVDQNKTLGVDTQDKQINQKIYDQYVESFKKGVYDLIKEDYDPATQEIIPRKYFSGGTKITDVAMILDSSMTVTKLEVEELQTGINWQVATNTLGIVNNAAITEISKATFLQQVDNSQLPEDLETMRARLIIQGTTLSIKELETILNTLDKKYTGYNIFTAYKGIKELRNKYINSSGDDSYHQKMKEQIFVEPKELNAVKIFIEKVMDVKHIRYTRSPSLQALKNIVQDIESQYNNNFLQKIPSYAAIVKKRKNTFFNNPEEHGFISAKNEEVTLVQNFITAVANAKQERPEDIKSLTDIVAEKQNKFTEGIVRNMVTNLQNDFKELYETNPLTKKIEQMLESEDVTQEISNNIDLVNQFVEKFEGKIPSDKFQWIVDHSMMIEEVQKPLEELAQQIDGLESHQKNQIDAIYTNTNSVQNTSEIEKNIKTTTLIKINNKITSSINNIDINADELHDLLTTIESNKSNPSIVKTSKLVLNHIFEPFVNLDLAKNDKELFNNIPENAKQVTTHEGLITYSLGTSKNKGVEYYLLQHIRGGDAASDNRAVADDVRRLLAGDTVNLRDNAMASTKNLKDLSDEELKDKRVAMRLELNVPIDEKTGEITDDTRIAESIPTIKYLMDKSPEMIIITAHMGRPEGQEDPTLSLKKVVKNIAEKLWDDGLGRIYYNPIFKTMADVEAYMQRPGVDEKAFKNSIIVLENVRFNKAETILSEAEDVLKAAKKSSDPHVIQIAKENVEKARETHSQFSQKLYKGVDVFINDAFGAAHRNHASVTGAEGIVPIRVSGLLLDKELKMAEKVRTNTGLAVVGGSKVSDKIIMLETLLKNPNLKKLLIGGAMANAFLKAQKIDMGASLAQDKDVELAKELFRKYSDKIILPIDGVVADKFEEGANNRIITDIREGVEDGWMMVDIGPKTVQLFTSEIQKISEENPEQSIFWNGPMGAFDVLSFAQNGTKDVGKSLALADNLTVTGGGDSVTAINQFEIKGIKFISTGGGSFLKLLEGGSNALPGVATLTKVIITQESDTNFQSNDVEKELMIIYSRKNPENQKTKDLYFRVSAQFFPEEGHTHFKIVEETVIGPENKIKQDELRKGTYKGDFRKNEDAFKREILFQIPIINNDINRIAKHTDVREAADVFNNQIIMKGVDNSMSSDITNHVSSIVDAMNKKIPEDGFLLTFKNIEQVEVSETNNLIELKKELPNLKSYLNIFIELHKNKFSEERLEIFASKQMFMDLVIKNAEANKGDIVDMIKSVQRSVRLAKKAYGQKILDQAQKDLNLNFDFNNQNQKLKNILNEQQITYSKDSPLLKESNIISLLQNLADNAMLENRVKVSQPNKTGGINLDPAMLKFEVKRDGNGIVLPFAQQPDAAMRVDGVVPVILNVIRIPSMLPLLGLSESDMDSDFSRTAPGLFGSPTQGDVSWLDRYRQKFCRKEIDASPHIG